jgi:hypothetical protein
VSELTSRLELQQQCPGGHVLQPPRPVAPVPFLRQDLRQPPPAPVRIRSHQFADAHDILRRYLAALHKESLIHAAKCTKSGNWSPVKNARGSHPVPVTPRGAFYPVKQQLQFFRSQASARAFARRPSERPALETLRADPEPGAVKPDHLYTVAQTVGVYEQMSLTLHPLSRCSPLLIF